MTPTLSWYAQRLRGMSVTEVAARSTDQARRLAWAHRAVTDGTGCALPRGLRAQRAFQGPIPRSALRRVSPEAKQALLDAADGILAGRWTSLGVARHDIREPDWFLDPSTGRRAPSEISAFRIDHRDERTTGNVKVVWELSRHHHLTVLAAAWWLTQDTTYADLAAEQLHDWWVTNPFLRGIHWTSGIELGIRLISWVWVRRFLDGWPDVESLFEHNDMALKQIWWHQEYLDGFRSVGSSANNHVVAEAAGRLSAACAFPWYAESSTWREDALRQLSVQLEANTFPSGINRELASDYHRFVAELALVGAAEANHAGYAVEAATWRCLTSCVDAAAALLDRTGRAPRQGDGDEGRALVVDGSASDPWASLLSTGAQVVGSMPWWPAHRPTVAAAALGSLVSAPTVPGRPRSAPDRFPDAGIHLLRTASEDGPQIWCRCDGGPHGYTSIAAHAHADALSIELRCDGVDIFADPGTYCYHGEPVWRRYFRSTLAHNTVEIDGVSQSVDSGPFMWRSHAGTSILSATDGVSGTSTWRARHDGYGRLDPALRHTRTVSLDHRRRELRISDVVTASRRHDVRMAFHLGPQVDARMTGELVRLEWDSQGTGGAADAQLPPQLSWSIHRGESDPPLGWYSPSFGVRVPSWTLVGHGVLGEVLELETLVRFEGRAHELESAVHHQRVVPRHDEKKR